MRLSNLNNKLTAVMTSLYGTMGGGDRQLGSSSSSINSIGSSLGSSRAHSSLSINGTTTVTTSPDVNNGSLVNRLNQPASVNTFGSVNPDITSEIDLNTTSETDADERKKYVPNILERALERTICYHPRRRSKPSKLTIFLLSVLVVMCHSASLIILPIYASSMQDAGSDEGVMTLVIAGLVPVVMIPLSLILRHLYDKTITMKPTASICLYVSMGICYAVGLNMLMFSSNPERVPWGLQAPFSSIRIVFSAIAFLIIKQKAISCRRLFCVLVMMVGVFIMAEPTIWDLDGSQEEELFYGKTTLESILWPAIYCMSYLPVSIYYVLADRELKKNKIHPFSLATSSLLSGVVFTLAMFGTDFIPWYGHVDNFEDFWDKFKTGYRCNFTYATDCKHTLIKLVILVTCLMCVNAFSFILIYATEGAVFTALISALAIPVAQGFWSLFAYEYDTDEFSWSPTFTHNTAFILGGLGLAVPAVVAYKIFSEKDARNIKRETKGYSDVSSSEYD